jgi:apolipoprotein N-acyltransferase
LNKKHLFLSILSGLLFAAGWPVNGFPLLLFFAFVPLMIIEADYIKKTSNKLLFFYIYTAFFIWNLLTTWWVYNATKIGGIFAMVVNSLLMTLTFLLFHFVRKRLPEKMAFPFLVFIWISFEKFHLNWDFSWPWLHLGNGFSEYPAWIQWYEYTGYFGGSLWVLIVNVLIYKILSTSTETNHYKKTIRQFIKPLLVIIIPIAISFYIYHHYKTSGKQAKISIIQPNLDPWKEKFKYNNTQLVQNFLELANPDADLILTPETAISRYTEIKTFAYSTPYKLMKEFVRQHNTTLLTGVDFIHWFGKDEKISETANKSKRGRWYDMYNSAVIIYPRDSLKIYHKSKLVVGAEYTPFRKILVPLIGDWVTKTIGVSMGSNVRQNERTVFNIQSRNIQIAPIICYESIYGEYVTGYVQKNANLLAVITNDGWWGDTPGYRQHLSYARLRAIENRRDVVQSANTGISAHIDQKGNIIQQLDYEKRGEITANVHLNKQKSFYSRYGDYIARVSIFMTILLLLYAFVPKKIRLTTNL